MDIGYLFKVIWEKKWLIIGLPLISCLVAFVSTINMEDKYRAVTQISTGFTTDEGPNVTDERFNLRGVDVKFSNLLSTMNSGILFNLVSYRLMIHDLDPANEPFHRIPPESNISFTLAQLDTARRVFQEKLSEFKPIVITEKHAKLLRDLLQAYQYSFNFVKGNTGISRVNNTDYIEINFISAHPRLSAFAANAYCEEFLRYYSLVKSEKSGESVEFFKNLADQKKKELEEKSNALKDFKSNHSFLNIEMQGESKLAQVAALEAQRDEISSNLYGLRLKLTNLRETLAELNGTSADGSRGSNANIISLRQKIDDLNEKYITSGGNNTKLLDSLNLLRQQYRYELNISENRINTTGDVQMMSKPQLQEAIKQKQIDIQVAESKLRKINSNIYNISGSLSGFATNESNLKDLERDVQVASNEYLDAIDKYNEAQNILMVSTSSISQTYKATPPASPESSQRLIILALAGIATFGLCILVVVILEVMDSSIKTPNQFQKAVDIPLAGSLIKINVKKLNFNTLFAQQHSDQELESFKHFLRKIRYEIEKTEAKSFMVTSPKVGEGKTFILFALAYVLSLVQRRVLIIDTNFKNNTLTKWLSGPRKNLKLLEKRNDEVVVKMYDPNKEEEPEDDSPVNLVTPTKYKNIFLIGNAGGFDSPEEIFHGKDFKNLMGIMRNDFDYIFIEGASLNDYSDSKELMKYVEKVIPVFSAESSIKQLDKESIEYLLTMEGRLTGAILNKVEMENLNV